MASARKLGASAVLGETAAGAFQRSVDKGFGEANESRVIDALRVAEEGGRVAERAFATATRYASEAWRERLRPPRRDGSS